MEARQSRLVAVRQVKRQVEQRLLHRANVVGVGVGYKNSQGASTRELAVVVSVREKVPLADLAAADRVPRAIGGVTTDVLETGELRALTLLAVPPRLDAFAPLATLAIDPTEKMRPARPGVSLGHSQVTAGTFGCLVRRGGDVLILSNNHVLANSNRANVGDAIWQPGRADGGTPDDQLGNLVDFVPIAFDGEDVPPPPGQGDGCAPVLGLLARLLDQLQFRAAALPGANAPGNNLVDCALARPTTPDLVNPDILGIGVPVGVGQATLGTQVQKSGRTTGHTRGSILQLDVTATIRYGDQSAVFTNQLMAGAMSQGGDSGSLVLDLRSQAVGLLFAGSPATTVITPIQFVLDALGAEMVTSA